MDNLDSLDNLDNEINQQVDHQAPGWEEGSVIDRHPLVTTPDTLMPEAIAMMSQGRQSCIFIVAHEEGAMVPLGMLTEWDIVRLTATETDLLYLPVSGVMTRNLIAIREEQAEDIMALTHLFREHRVRHLPVVDDRGHLVGLVTSQTVRNILKPVDLFRLKQVQEVMSADMIHAPPQTNLLEVVQLMSQHSSNCVVITRTQFQIRQDTPGAEAYSALIPVGIVTERDVLDFHCRRLDLSHTTAGAVMSTPLFLVQLTDSMWVAHQMMQRLKVQRLVVSNAKGELAGVITQSNLLAAIDPLEIYQTISTLKHLVNDQTVRLTTVNYELQGEINERKLLEEKLASSESKIRGIFEAMTDVILTVHLDSGSWESLESIDVAPVSNKICNEQHLAVVNATINKFFQTQVDWVQRVQRVLTTGVTEQFDYSLEIEGCCLWFDATLSPLKGDAVIFVGRDVSDRKRSELMLQETVHRDRALTTAIQRIRQSLDIQTIFNSTVEELRQVTKCDRVLIYQFSPDWSGEFVAESVGSGWVSLMENQTVDPEMTAHSLDDPDCSVGQMQRLSKRGAMATVKDTYLQDTKGGLYKHGVNYLAVEDIHQRGFPQCYVDLLDQFQAKAYLTVPIYLGDKLWGLLASYQNSEPRSWQIQEINTVLQISLQLGVALQQAELLRQTQRQAEDLRQALVAADAANLAKSQFLANMSHELRTPLNAILGFAQIMNRDTTLSSEYQQYLEIINRAGSHLLGLINDVLEMSKIEAGKVVLNPNAFSLHTMLNNLESMFRLKAESKGLELVFNCDRHLPESIFTDESKLRQVLINLLSNAIKFTNQGLVSLTVREEEGGGKEGRGGKEGKEGRGDLVEAVPSLVQEELESLETTNGVEHTRQIRLFFEIKDTGVGIEAQELPLLFQPFRQTNSGLNSQQGTGLGLPISSQYVQLLGGNIEVESSPAGSSFSFAIEALVAPSQPSPNPTNSEAQVLALASGQETYRILVVDDVPENRLLVNRILSPVGFSIAEAENGLQAIALWQSWQPHLILMDMLMPTLDGYEATRTIRDREQKLNLPEPTYILALTAVAFQEQKQQILAAGCNDIILKPLQSSMLLNKIEQYLQLRYTYQKIPAHPIRQRHSTQAITLEEIIQLLHQRPRNWLDQLRQAAAQGSDELILQLVAQIPPKQESLAVFLNNLARDFQFERIIEIIHQV